MADKFQATDPRGRTVICTEETWVSHVVWRHPGMDGKEDEVKAAIESPSMGIFGDKLHENRNIYYRLQRNRRRYTKVIVAFDDQNAGSVLTAFQVDAPKDGEPLIWLGRNT